VFRLIVEKANHSAIGSSMVEAIRVQLFHVGGQLFLTGQGPQQGILAQDAPSIEKKADLQKLSRMFQIIVQGGIGGHGEAQSRVLLINVTAVRQPKVHHRLQFGSGSFRRQGFDGQVIIRVAGQDGL